MYINDIAEKLISLTRLFADDTSFGYSNRDELQIKTVIAHDLKELDEWSKKWLMTFNSDKTEIMLFSNTDIPEFNFTFNERTIPITNSHKHLGVTFSSEDSWVNILFLKMLSDITFEHLVKNRRLIFIRHYYLGMVSVFICSTMFKDESGKKKPLKLSFYVFGVKHHSTRYALNCVCIFDDIRSIENSTCN